jgi:hypothetical protein
MTLVLTRDAVAATYDPATLDDLFQWSGDFGIISDLILVLCHDEVTLPYPGLTIRFDRAAPLHNVIASAMYLQLGISSRTPGGKHRKPDSDLPDLDGWP